MWSSSEELGNDSKISRSWTQYGGTVSEQNLEPTRPPAIAAPSLMPQVLKNFGRNIVLRPDAFAAPQTEEDVLRFLAEHRERKIRVLGSLHSWSEVIAGGEAVLDLRHLNSVQVEPREGRLWATLGGGCKIHHALAELERQAGATLPAVGLITAQAIAGAAATGTHGSGRHSISHYIDEVRIATYDGETGEPVIRTLRGGDELRAARCSLGALGVVLSVGLWCRPAYQVDEVISRHPTLESALNAETHSPLQQVFLVPWSWKYLSQQRRETTAPRSATAPLYRLYWLMVLDLGFHLTTIALARLFTGRWAARCFYRYIMPLTVIRGWRVSDVSYKQLTTRHDWFRHLELELFLPRSKLADFMGFAQEVLRHADGESNAFSPETQRRLDGAGVGESIRQIAGVYRHHFPICIRKILPDDTLISPASGTDEPWHSVSFVTFTAPQAREGFFRFAKTITACGVRLFQARPHWGKYCPLEPGDAEQLYPELAEFRAIACEFDRRGAFRNEWLERMGVSEPVSPSPANP